MRCLCQLNEALRAKPEPLQRVARPPPQQEQQQQQQQKQKQQHTETTRACAAVEAPFVQDAADIAAHAHSMLSQVQFT